MPLLGASLGQSLRLCPPPPQGAPLREAPLREARLRDAHRGAVPPYPPTRAAGQFFLLFFFFLRGLYSSTPIWPTCAFWSCSATVYICMQQDYAFGLRRGRIKRHWETFLVETFLVETFLVETFLVETFLVETFLVETFLVETFLVEIFLVETDYSTDF